MNTDCHIYTDAELASELVARGYRVLRPTDFLEIEVCETRTAYEIQQTLAVSPASLAAEIRGALVTRLSEALIASRQLGIRQEQNHSLRTFWKAGVCAFDPSKVFEPFGPKERPALPDDPRPTNCRNRLADEGKDHPKSGCAAPGCGGIFAPNCKSRRPQG